MHHGTWFCRLGITRCMAVSVAVRAVDACGPPARASDKITSLRSCRAPERAFESWLPPARLLDLGPRLDNQNPRAIAMSFGRTDGISRQADGFNRKYYVVPIVGTHQNFSAPKCHKPKKHCQTDQGRWPPPRPHFWVFCRPGPPPGCGKVLYRTAPVLVRAVVGIAV